MPDVLLWSGNQAKYERIVREYFERVEKDHSWAWMADLLPLLPKQITVEQFVELLEAAQK